MANFNSSSSNYHSISIAGEAVNSGIYLLGIELEVPRRVAFGQHKQGKLLDLRAGAYLYIGSAYGQKGSSSLGYRLLRHTARSGAAPPHRIQEKLLHHLQTHLIPGKTPARKSRHWHIDYLLDLKQAEIFYIHAQRTTRRLEQAAAETLATLPETVGFAPGLGASDHPGSTHLFYVNASRAWWQKLPDVLSG